MASPLQETSQDVEDSASLITSKLKRSWRGLKTYNRASQKNSLRGIYSSKTILEDNKSSSLFLVGDEEKGDTVGAKIIDKRSLAQSTAVANEPEKVRLLRDASRKFLDPSDNMASVLMRHTRSSVL